MGILDAIDGDVARLAEEMADLGREHTVSVFEMSPWIDGVVACAMSNPAFKASLFRLVDVFPCLRDDDALLRYLHEYLDEYFTANAGSALQVPGIDPSDLFQPRAARENFERLAGQFLLGGGLADTVDSLQRLWDGGTAFTLDLLGERTITESDADDYADRVSQIVATLITECPSWTARDLLDRDDIGPLSRVNVSVKPTALASLYMPLEWEKGIAQASSRLRGILATAASGGASIHLDMEHYLVKDMTLHMFRDLLSEPDMAEVDVGITIQAYLKDSVGDLLELIDWASQRARPVTVRLVKGAYWDSETIEARAAGWPVSVFESKAETDANYERCIRILHDHHGRIRAAFASHSLRSLAYAITYARGLGIPDNGYELQMLYGMAEPVQVAVRSLGLRLRLYAPVGVLVAGMGYLVRRLLENTSSDSFLRQHFVDHRPLAETMASYGGELEEPTSFGSRGQTDHRDPSSYAPEPQSEWHRSTVREEFGIAVALREKELRSQPIDVPAVIDGALVRTADTIASIDPSEPDHVVAVSASCGVGEADAAIAAATRALDVWRNKSAEARAEVIFGAADWMRQRRNGLASLEVFEAGKPWKEADADVCEAIDFCEYYGREALRLARGGTVQSAPGEVNSLRYRGKGVGLVISPWNFPLAIPAGMVVAALVTGNTVILKPAEQTPAVAAQLVAALYASGLPQGVLSFLPGKGEVVGDYLVRHPAVSFVVFTGSKAVGLQINAAAAVPHPNQTHVKRVVAEMGGKNPLVIDADADLDQAIPAVVASAFGYSGQKCSAVSRLIVVDPVYDQVIDRLVGATEELVIGNPKEMSTQVGPLIDSDAYGRVRECVARAPDRGRVVLSMDVPSSGYFVGPTIVLDTPADASIVREEIFGPVIVVQRAENFDEALRLANNSVYALTAGLFSRSPIHIAKASRELRAGNVYVNRETTGATVGRQAFGGFGLSGVGSKAGGPDYLLQFVDPISVTENTLRQGFAPPA